MMMMFDMYTVISNALHVNMSYFGGIWLRAVALTIHDKYGCAAGTFIGAGIILRS